MNSPIAFTPELMNQVYALVGFVVLSCATTIITVVIVAVKGSSKLSWVLSKFDSRVEKTEDDLNAYHDKHRKIDGEVEILKRANTINETVIEHHENRLNRIETRRSQ